MTTDLPISAAPSAGPSPSRLRFYRFVTLLSLLLSDGTYTVLRRYSRGVLHESYSVNEVLLMAEVIKIGFSICMIMMSKGGGGEEGLVGSPTKGRRPARVKHTTSHFMQLLLRSHKMLVLAVIYGVGNRLSYYALARVGAGTFVVIANLKTLTTAGFSAMVLGRTYSWTKWRALALLVAGVVLFLLPTLQAGGKDDDMSKDNLDNGKEDISGGSAWGMSAIVLGIAAEIVVVTLSGFASIYFEKAIKNDPFDIWERNFQLGFYSILMYSTLILSESGSEPLFSDWTPLAFTLSFLGATGGLLVALSIKYGDSVLKTLAISGSIIYSSVIDHIFLGGLFNEQMVLAAVVVVIAVLNYNFDTSSNIGIIPPPTFNQAVHISTSDLSVRRKDGANDWNDNEKMDEIVDDGRSE